MRAKYPAFIQRGLDRQPTWASTTRPPGAVDRAIKAGGVSDAFALIDEGLLNPYAAQVVAAGLVMDDPDLME